MPFLFKKSTYILVKVCVPTTRKYICLLTSIFDIPYSRQYKAYSCGQNSFRMVMGYWRKRLSKTKIFFWTGFRPTSISTYKKIIEKKFPGFSTKEIPEEPDFKSLISELDKEHPVIIGVETAFLKYLQ